MFVECENCKQRFDVSSDGVVNHKKEFKVKDKSIFLTYYDCPSCGRRHYVQIDDAISLNKLKRIEEMFIKISVAKKKGKAIPEKQLEKFKKARKNLSEYRINLMKEFTGIKISDETGTEYDLRFSV